MKYEIYKILIISTAHITDTDGAQLQFDANSNLCTELIVSKYDEFGHMIYVPKTKDPNREKYIAEKYSPSFMKLLEITRKQKCQYLRADRDGPVYDHLPTYEW